MVTHKKNYMRIFTFIYSYINNDLALLLNQVIEDFSTSQFYIKLQNWWHCSKTPKQLTINCFNTQTININTYFLTLTKLLNSLINSKTTWSPPRKPLSLQNFFHPCPIFIDLLGTFRINREQLVQFPDGPQSCKLVNPDFHRNSAKSPGKFFKKKENKITNNIVLETKILT